MKLAVPGEGRGQPASGPGRNPPRKIYGRPAPVRVAQMAPLYPQRGPFFLWEFQR